MTPDFILWLALNATIQFALFLRTTRCARGIALTLAGYGIYAALAMLCMRIVLPRCSSTTTMVQCAFFPFYLLAITLIWLLMKGNRGHRLFICLESTVYCAAYIILRHLFATCLPQGPLRHVLAIGAPILIASLLFFKVIPLLERMPRRANWTVLNLVAAGSVLFLFFSCIWPVWVATGDWTDLVRGGFALVVALAILPVGLAYAAARYREFAARQIADNERMLALEVRAMRAESDGARRVRHDIHHHLGQLAHLLKARDFAAAESYLQQMTDHELLQPARFRQWCANEHVNGLVNLAEVRAVKRGIAFSADIRLEGNQPLSDTDLVSLLGNLLENAVNGATTSVGLQMNATRGVLHLAVENTIAESFALVDGLPCEERGIGIQSVESVIAKYHGLFKYELRGNTLAARVFIGAGRRA